MTLFIILFILLPKTPEETKALTIAQAQEILQNATLKTNHIYK